MRGRRKVQICGLYVPTIGKPESYGGGHIYPGAPGIGTAVRVSSSTAAYLTTAFGRRMPRPGYEVQLCKDVWLTQLSYSPRGQYEVVRHGSGGMKGLKRRGRR